MEEGLDEALGLAVGLGPVGAGDHVAGPPRLGGLQVGPPGGVVHRYVDEVVAYPSRPSRPADLPAQEAVPAARRDASQLLDVQVEEFPRPLPDVAHRYRGGAIPVPETGETMTA